MDAQMHRVRNNTDAVNGRRKAYKRDKQLRGKSSRSGQLGFYLRWGDLAWWIGWLWRGGFGWLRVPSWLRDVAHCAGGGIGRSLGLVCKPTALASQLSIGFVLSRFLCSGLCGI